MPGGAVSDVKLGFWVGLGVALALAIFAIIQGFAGGLVNRG